MIEFKDVCMRFDDKDALKHISLTIYDGETLAIIGGSGSGKSTFLRLLIGLIKPTSGQILIDGQDIVPMSEAELNKVRLKMGMVFQYSALFDSMTVGENVAFGLREHTKLSDADIKEIVRENFGELFAARADDFANTAAPGGESFAQLQRRGIEAFYRILEESRGTQNILLVAHGGIFWTISNGYSIFS